ncbi:hypothetical protein ES703_44062 [subsurface metagenome]
MDKVQKLNIAILVLFVLLCALVVWLIFYTGISTPFT